MYVHCICSHAAVEKICLCVLEQLVNIFPDRAFFFHELATTKKISKNVKEEMLLYSFDHPAKKCENLNFITLYLRF